MISVLVLCLVVAASAAPRYRHSHYPFNDDFAIAGSHFDHHPAFGDEVFDTSRFWADLETQIRQMDEMISSFRQHFPSSSSSDGVVGNEYKVTIPMSGFDEKDIAVKAREGVLMVQAVHKVGDTSERSYLEVRNLPANIDVAGVWTYAHEVLTVVFPLKNKVTTVAPEISTQAPSYTTEQVSREEMEKEDDGNTRDPDVGVLPTDSKDDAIRTNEINHGVEATTYAVDLKNEVEFVPVHYR